MKISIIVAMAEGRVMGKDNKLPWHIPEDLKWFKKHTASHPVVMGRKTFESIGNPLPGRKNIIITRQKSYSVEGVCVVHSLQSALNAAHTDDNDEIFIIGGESIFRQALGSTTRMYLTLIHASYEGDSFFPDFPEEHYRKIFEETHDGPPPFTFLILERQED
jgi:dihydrofolate reductase